MTAHGPDFGHCGQPVEWRDRQPIDERFPAAIAAAMAAPGIDIELARWSREDPLADEYAKWWNAGQLDAVRRHIASIPHDGYKAITSRRVDHGDGFTKCYVRFDRRRLKAVA